MSQPADTAVYASPHTSRCAAQDSRPEWLAIPYSVGLFHPLLSAGLPAHNYKILNWTGIHAAGSSNLRSCNLQPEISHSSNLKI